MRTLGHFGSAGSSRSLRGTTLGTGVRVTTATAHRISEPRRDVGRQGDPSADELRAYCLAMQCWWCDDGRVWKSLSAHLACGHRMDLQYVRDLLGVPKHTSFIDEDLRERFVANGSRNYDPAKLRPLGNPRQLSACGRENSRAHLKLAYQKICQKYGLTPQQYGSRVNAQKHANRHPCQVCGTTIPKGRTLTCNPSCETELRHRRAVNRLADPAERTRQLAQLRIASQHSAMKYRGVRHERPCKRCGRIFRPARRTEFCAECLPLAKKETRLKAATTQRAKGGSPTCNMGGCDSPRLARGMCGRHYQRWLKEMQK